ncbi:MAG: hypothetical protein AB1742_06975 [bacterium]
MEPASCKFIRRNPMKCYSNGITMKISGTGMGMCTGTGTGTATGTGTGTGMEKSKKKGLRTLMGNGSLSRFDGNNTPMGAENAERLLHRAILWYSGESKSARGAAR